MTKHLPGFIVPGFIILSLTAAPVLAGRAADDPPADVAAKVSSDAKAVGTAVKRDARVIAEAAKEGAQQVAVAATEVAHEVAVASKEGAKEVAAAAKRGAEKTKAAVKADKSNKAPRPAINPDSDADRKSDNKPAH
jgi:hypothetical protein